MNINEINNCFVNMKNLSSKMNELKIKTPGTMNVAEIMNRQQRHKHRRMGRVLGITGSADNAVELYLKGELKGNQNATCAGHGHGK